MFRLDEYSRDEWYSVVRSVLPELSESEYDRMWADFQSWKEAAADCKGTA